MMNIYIPLTKKDEDKRIVEGFASTEQMDTQGEIIELSAIEQALPDYMKFANIREMHQYSAVGKTIEARIDTKKKGLYIVVKVVDDIAWKKVKEGVYNGFSIGGRILKKIGDTIKELSLSEISLVDRPANPGAVFSLYKAEGGVEDMKKQMPMPEVDNHMEEEVKYPGIKIADRLIAMATSLAYLSEECTNMKRPVKGIEKAITSLKAAAMEALTMEKAIMEDQMAKEKTGKMGGLTDVKVKLQKISDSKVIEPWSQRYFETMTKLI
jgi:phage head maturation protease